MRQDRHADDGEPRLLRQLLLRTADPEYTLAIAAAMETLSTHPYARALIGAVQSLGKSLPPLTDGRVEASAGIEATVGGRRYRLGKMEFALVDKQAAQRADVAAIAAREGLHAASTIVLADAEGPVALFVFGERLRDDAASMIDTVAERGVEPILISGDRRAPVTLSPPRSALNELLRIKRRTANANGWSVSKGLVTKLQCWATASTMRPPWRAPTCQSRWRMGPRLRSSVRI